MGNPQNFHEKKNKINETVARALMIGDRALYAKAIVANRDMRGSTRPKSA